jgi:hypothetical protein
MTTPLVLSLLLLGQTLSADEVMMRLQRQGMCRAPAPIVPSPGEGPLELRGRGVLWAALEEDALPNQSGVATLRLTIRPTTGDTVVVRVTWDLARPSVGDVVTKVLSGRWWSEAGVVARDFERLTNLQKRALPQLRYDAEVLWIPGALSTTMRPIDGLDIDVLGTSQRAAWSHREPAAPSAGIVDLGPRDGTSWTFEWSDGHGVTVREAHSPTRGALFELGLRLLELSQLPPAVVGLAVR